MKRLFIALVLLVCTVSFVNAESITLAWDANTESDLDGYKLYYGTSTGNYLTPIDVGNVTTYELSGLDTGVTYYIALTAYDTVNNESEKSDEISASPPDTEAPSVPIELLIEIRRV